MRRSDDLGDEDLLEDGHPRRFLLEYIAAVTSNLRSAFLPFTYFPQAGGGFGRRWKRRIPLTPAAISARMPLVHR